MAVANQKGGTGKTTLVVNLAVALGERDRRVLVVDLDPQANATTLLGQPEVGASGENPGTDAQGPVTLYHVFMGDPPLSEAIAADVAPNVDLARGDVRLKYVELHLTQQVRREEFVRAMLEVELDAYDYVLIDCPPNLGNLTLNAFVAASEIVTPVSMKSPNSARGVLRDVRTTLADLRRGGIKREITAVVLTNVAGDGRNAYRANLEALKRSGLHVCASWLGDRAAFHDAEALSRPLALYDSRHEQLTNLRSLAAEIEDLRIPAAVA